MNTWSNSLKFSARAVILAGLIILLIGLYYWIVKAGIPYQDPTPEMQLRYEIDMRIGDELIKDGCITALIGIAGRAAAWLTGKRKR